MATKYFCDVCENEVNSPEELTSLNVGKPEKSNHYNLPNRIREELCERCYSNLNNYLKSEKVKDAKST